MFEVADDLETTEDGYVLSARQGYVLNQKIENHMASVISNLDIDSLFT